MLECPQDTPQHQCVTVTDLISYSTNSSLNQERNITIHFLPGVHTPRVGGRILIENENWNTTNLTATLTGEQSGWSEAVLQCGLSKIAFVIYRIFQLILINIRIHNCGFATGISIDGSINKKFRDIRSTEYTYYLNSKITSIGIINNVPTQNSVFMDCMTINNSSGFGVLVIQYCFECNGNTGTFPLLTLHIVNSIINSDSSSSQPEDEYGGNLFIRARSELHIIGNNLTVSYNFIDLTRQLTYWTFLKYGGMDIVVEDGFISFMFNDSKFMGNEAGGLSILYRASKALRNYNKYGRVVINNCMFLNNKALDSGGGIYIDASEAISVSIRSTLFKENSARRDGGGVLLYTENLNCSIDECVFIQNAADRGAAIFSRQMILGILSEMISPMITLSQSLLTNNTGYTHSKNGVIGLYFSTMILDNVNITDNNCRGLLTLGSRVIISQTVLISNNYAVGGDGGGIYITKHCDKDRESQLIFNPKSLLVMYNNKADKKGGGIYLERNVCRYKALCTFIVFDVITPVVLMVNNTARIAGNSIFGGNLDACTYEKFWKIFNIKDRYISSTISSKAQKTCICSSDYFTHNLNCKSSLNATIFPGQTLNVSVMCIGQLGYPSSCSFQTGTITGAGVALVSKAEDAKAQCTRFSYFFRTKSTGSNSVSLILLSSIGHVSSGPQDNTVVIQIKIDECPMGFKTALNNDNLICTCSDHLHKEGIVCNIDELTLYKTAPMWVGNYSGDITVHRNCPFGYCKTNFTAVNPYNQQDQCDWKRSGVLCGACRPGLSLVLGTSQCKQCSSVYLLLLIPFALAGVVLVLLLLKCNLTVSMGTINGLIFYANIVQATKTAFFPTGSNSTFTHILSVFIAWLNLDLGIETCFAEGLNTYHRTWLQFVFPVYIWSLVGVMIVVSRYSIRVSRWTGSNTVSVLATLLLLSYAKLLRVTFDVFTSTSLTDANGTTTLVWLLDGNYVFLQWPHSLLFTAALVTLLGHIVPYSLLCCYCPQLSSDTHTTSR